MWSSANICLHIEDKLQQPLMVTCQLCSIQKEVKSKYSQATKKSVKGHCEQRCEIQGGG